MRPSRVPVCAALHALGIPAILHGVACGALLWACAPLAVGCGERRSCEDGVGSDGRCLLPNELDCSDGRDDDGDGFVDCADAECKEDSACPVTPPELCDNLIDDDSDGLIDCDDDECFGIGFDGSQRFPGCDCAVA